MLYLPRQSFHESSLPLISCIKHKEMPYYDLVIILGDINRFLYSLPILLLYGCLAFVLRRDARLNRIV
jgi:hypothetical protein